MTIYFSLTPEGVADVVGARVADELRADAHEAEIEALVSSGAVTPELLLQLAQNRLQDLDGQIRDVMAKMNERTELARSTSERLSMLRDAMSAMSSRYDSNGNFGGNPLTDTVVFRGETMTVNELANRLHQSGVDSAGAASIGGRANLQNLIDAAGDELREINSGNELLMISLQSTMQQRTAIISSTTNLLKAIDEGNDAVVANLR
jgi:hypothetical protein